MVIIGGGDLQPRLAEIGPEESSVRDRIFFVGKVQLEQLKGYYSKADVFVMPSRQEGFGIVFLGDGFWQAGGLAATGGAPEIVQDGITGFLVNPDDLEGLTCRLILLLQDEAFRKKMGEAGRQRVEENFTVLRFEQRLTKLLDAPT